MMLRFKMLKSLMILMVEMILAVRDGICLSQLYVCWRSKYFNVFHILRHYDG